MFVQIMKKNVKYKYISRAKKHVIKCHIGCFTWFCRVNIFALSYVFLTVKCIFQHL